MSRCPDLHSCRRNSSRAIVSRCTSSGPSASLRVLAAAQASARKRSATHPGCSMCLNRAVNDPQRHIGATTLIIAISVRAGLISNCVHQMSGFQGQEPCLFDFNSPFGNVPAPESFPVLPVSFRKRFEFSRGDTVDLKTAARPAQSVAYNDEFARGPGVPGQFRIRGPLQAEGSPPGTCTFSNVISA